MIKLLLATSLILIAISIATCHFGPEYDRSLEPSPEEKGFIIYDGADSVGDRWIMIGTLIFAVGAGLGLAAVRIKVANKERGHQLKNTISLK